MSSILTNMAAMTAVQNLAATQKSLADTQNQISTGLAIGSAKDNAAYFSIAQGLRTNVSNLSAVSSSLNLGTSVLSTATAATNNVYSVLQSIQKNLVSAAQPGNDLSALQTSIATLRQQLGTTVSTASFNGVNLLDGSNPTSVSFVSGVTGSGSNTVVNQLAIATGQTNLSGAGYVTGTNATANAAVTADANAATAKSNFSQLQSFVKNAIAGFTSSDFTVGTAVTTSNSTANFKAVFGAGATMSTGGAVTYDATSAFAQLLGTSATMTFTAPTAYTVGGTQGGAVTAYFGSGATLAATTLATNTSTTAATATAGSLAKTASDADTAAAASAATFSTYLVDNAVATSNAKFTALNSFNSAKTAFTSAVASLGTSDLANGSTSAAFYSVFGTGASISGGVVSGISATSTAGTLMGSAGSYTVSGGSFTTGGSTAATGGALYSLYGFGSSSSTTDATATGGASFTATQAATAINSNAGAQSTFNGGLFAISQINLNGASAAQIANYTSQVGAALSSITNAQEVLGAASSNLSLQTTYTSTLSDSLTTGVGSLVDADMNEASTRLNALQTQQQLGVQALSVANQNSQLILKLFGA